MVGDERKRGGAREEKGGRTQARNGVIACKTFFNDPLLVKQELLCPLIG